MRGATVAAAALVLALAGCAIAGGGSVQPPPATSGANLASPEPTPSGPTASASASPRPSAPVSTAAAVLALSDAQWARIVATGTWRPGCPVGRTGLRLVELTYVGFDRAAHRGSLVVNADVAASVVHIFASLYAQRFPIRAMVPVEAYGGDDNASMAADNTSAFNCRQPVQANAPSTKSPHANGRAIDLNPYENPWQDPRCGCFQPDAFYGSHRVGAGVISNGGLAWRAFTAQGWIWQDAATIDYQHFDTGYPSRPLP
jgi:D-alanyl-D-alanine carboxypeptidase